MPESQAPLSDRSGGEEMRVALVQLLAATQPHEDVGREEMMRGTTTTGFARWNTLVKARHHAKSVLEET